MSQPSKDIHKDRASRFVHYLLTLVEQDDRGALAALRRSLQEPTGVAMSACPYVVPFLSTKADRFAERTFFLVAALFSLHPQHAPGVSLGHAFRRINRDTPEGQKGADNQSTRSRFVALLDAHEDDVAEHMRHAVSLARTKDIPLDWIRLCRDLRHWGADDRWVQRRLASDFWAADPVSPISSPEPSTSEQQAST